MRTEPGAFRCPLQTSATGGAIGLAPVFGSGTPRPLRKERISTSSRRASVATDARRLEVEILSFRNGRGVPDPKTGASPIAPPVALVWRGHRNAPGSVRIRIGDWPSGLYFVRVATHDGWAGYAPFVVRPRDLGTSRIAVVLPT